MAAHQGYQCEFIDSVFDDFFCKKCSLVARRLTIAACCGESFCHACIAAFQKERNPCPQCGEKDFTTFEQVKNQKKINSLHVYCSMKERGCDWSGTLEQLDTHLDPDKDNCQYVDTKCPLNCNMAISKNKVEQHVAQHCAKRPYICQHCNFKATYKEVVEKHLAECKYVPLQCPNLCGVTFERDFMEDHMKMCRLEEVVCEFSGVGCKDRFRREDQEEHTRQNSQKHLTLTASLAVETKEHIQHEKEEQLKELEKMIKEQDNKILKQEKELKEVNVKLVQQEKNLGDKEKKQQALMKKVVEHEKKLNEKRKENEVMEQKVREHNNNQMKALQIIQKLEEQNRQLSSKLQKLEQLFKQVVDRSIESEQELAKLASTMRLHRKFEMKNFSREKARNASSTWKSPAMYTHGYGYKFCIGVDANGSNDGRGRSVWVDLFSMAGEFDDKLEWPVKLKITIELVNQKGGKNASHSMTKTWRKPFSRCSHISGFLRLDYGFIDHSELQDFLSNDTLFFCVSNIHVL